MGVLFGSFKWAMITPEKGAKTPLYLAHQPLPQPSTGRYYDKCKPRNATAIGRDIEAAKRLYAHSEALIQAALA